MDTMKKIYIVAIILTIATFGFEIAFINENLTTATDVGRIIYRLLTPLLLSTFLLSRTANIYGNRDHMGLGFIFACLSFIYTIIYTIFVIVTYDESILDVDTSVVDFCEKIMYFLIANALIFEVPAVNSTHKKFQYATAIVLIVFLVVMKISDVSLNSAYTSSFGYYESLESSIKLEMSILFIWLAMVIINPMLRIYYIDRDYSNARDVYDSRETILTSMDLANKTTTEMNKPATPAQAVPVSNPEPVKEETTPIVLKPTPEDEPVPDATESHHEPVINKNYKPEEMPAAEIPTVTTETQTENKQ